MIYYNCPHCHNSIRVSDAAAGRKGTCNQCGEVIRIPDRNTAATAELITSTKSQKRILIGAAIALVAVTCGFAYAIHAFSVSQINKDYKYRYQLPPDPPEPIAEQDNQQKIDIASVVLPDDYRTINDTSQIPPTVDFNSRTWQYVGYAKGVYGRSDMIPIMYTAGERDKRLVVEYATAEEQVYYEMTYEQKRMPSPHGSKWVNDGLRENVLLDGSKDRESYFNGEPHGLSRTWYPSGQLRKEETYSYGKIQGLARGWWENGNLQYEATYVGDKEVSGKSFREDGTER